MSLLLQQVYSNRPANSKGGSPKLWANIFAEQLRIQCCPLLVSNFSLLSCNDLTQERQNPQRVHRHLPARSAQTQTRRSGCLTRSVLPYRRHHHTRLRQVLRVLPQLQVAIHQETIRVFVWKATIPLAALMSVTVQVAVCVPKMQRLNSASMSAVWNLDVTVQDAQSIWVIAKGVRIALDCIREVPLTDIKSACKNLTKDRADFPALALLKLNKQLIVFGLVLALARHTFGDFIERYRTALTFKLESTGMLADQAEQKAKTEANKRTGLDLPARQLYDKYQVQNLKVNGQRRRQSSALAGVSIPHLGSYIRDALNHSPGLRALGEADYKIVSFRDKDHFECTFQIQAFQEFTLYSCRSLLNNVEDGLATDALNMPTG